MKQILTQIMGELQPHSFLPLCNLQLIQSISVDAGQTKFPTALTLLKVTILSSFSHHNDWSHCAICFNPIALGARGIFVKWLDEFNIFSF